jgi:hypothetical protein
MLKLVFEPTFCVTEMEKNHACSVLKNIPFFSGKYMENFHGKSPGKMP